MRALVITPDGVTEIDMDDSVSAITDAIGCDIFCSAGHPAENHIAFVDDMGWLTARPGDPAFRVAWHQCPLVGNIVVQGFDDTSGESAPATIGREELRDMVALGEVRAA